MYVGTIVRGDECWQATSQCPANHALQAVLPRMTAPSTLLSPACWGDFVVGRLGDAIRRRYPSERRETPAGAAPWLCATARVMSPPSWLNRYTAASFAFLPVQESSFTQPGDADHIRKGWINEVSILSPAGNPPPRHYASPAVCWGRPPGEVSPEGLPPTPSPGGRRAYLYPSLPCAKALRNPAANGRD